MAKARPASRQTTVAESRTEATPQSSAYPSARNPRWHSNILAIHDAGDHEGLPYVAVELLEGDTLRIHSEASPLPLSTALDFAVQIGRGLAAAHDRGIVHRDLKPENIFVTLNKQVKLLDFGLATEPAREAGDEMTRLASADARLVLGTAGSMSPEQARGERADARSDIFSFGCVLYEMSPAGALLQPTARSKFWTGFLRRTEGRSRTAPTGRQYSCRMPQCTRSRANRPPRCTN